jgi:tRNA modification GTPase
LTELGLRPAEPGEFTRRAFENGKLDLTEAEGIADLIAAETEIQRRQAVRQMEGSLGRLYETWRARLVRAAALLEVVIDFPDEEVPVNTPDDVIEILETIERDIGQHLLDDHKGERVRDGLRVAVIGAPNVGKSSLVNALARRDAAIVSDVSGTTRDVIEVHLDLAGLPVTVADTAGLRQAGGAVEAEGIRRARKAAAAADIRVFMYDATATDQQIPWGVEPNSGDVSVLNKIDLVREGGGRIRDYIPEPVIPISVKTGAGVRGLLERLTQIATQLVGSGWEGNLTRARHRIALVECQAALHRCLESRPNDIALWAEDVRLGAGALGRITGKIDVESILDAVFSEFCIGK